jgi:4-amino-4-deoxy-L-arabinose transferase-like glycosyltransferase
VMVILLGALAFRWIDDPGWSLALPSVLAAAPILLAAVHTVPSAKRLGRRVDGPERQTRLARAICRDHLLCLAFMSLFLAVWVAA